MQISYLCPRSTHIFPLSLREVEPVHRNIFRSWFVLFPSNLSQNMLLMKLEFLYYFVIVLHQNALMICHIYTLYVQVH